MDQWGVVNVLLWSNAWDTQASAGVLVIVTVVKLESLSRVVLCLGGGAGASRNQLISCKGGGVSCSRAWGLVKGDGHRRGAAEGLSDAMRAVPRDSRRALPGASWSPCAQEVTPVAGEGCKQVSSIQRGGSKGRAHGCPWLYLLRVVS